MSVSEDDADRVRRQFEWMSRSEQEEKVSSLRSFTDWIKGIAALADLIPYVVKLYKWIKKRMGY
jgi:hypothetical protein